MGDSWREIKKKVGAQTLNAALSKSLSSAKEKLPEKERKIIDSMIKKISGDVNKVNEISAMQLIFAFAQNPKAMEFLSIASGQRKNIKSITDGEIVDLASGMPLEMINKEWTIEDAVHHLANLLVKEGYTNDSGEWAQFVTEDQEDVSYTTYKPKGKRG